MGVRGCMRRRFSQTTQEAHPMGEGVDPSLTAIPLTPDPSPALGDLGILGRDLESALKYQIIRFQPSGAKSRYEERILHI